jgi:hypothetical protein
VFTTKLNLFSIGTIIIPYIHTKLVSKLNCILNLSIVGHVPKQLVELVCVLFINLIIPPNIVKQHLPETFLHTKKGEMIINETPT